MGESVASGYWKRIAPGHYSRIGSDGTTELATIVRDVIEVSGTSRCRECWSAFIYPRGQKRWAEKRTPYATLKEAKYWAEVAYHQLSSEIRVDRG